MQSAPPAPAQGPRLLPPMLARRPTSCCLLRWGTARPQLHGQHPGRADTEPSRCPPSPGGCVWDPAFRADTAQPTSPQSPPVRHTRIRPQGNSVPDQGSVSLEQNGIQKPCRSAAVLGGARMREGCQRKSTLGERKDNQVTQLFSRCKVIMAYRTKSLSSNGQHLSAYVFLQRHTG